MTPVKERKSFPWIIAISCLLAGAMYVTVAAAQSLQDSSGSGFAPNQSVVLLVMLVIIALFLMFTARHLTSMIGIPKEDNYGRFAEFFGNAKVGVSVVDADMRIVRSNEPFEQLTGFSKAELLGMPCTELVVDPEEDDANIVAGMIDQFGDSHQLYIQRKDGSRFRARFVVMPAPRGIERDGSIIMLEEGLTHSRTSRVDSGVKQGSNT